jgi:hypothetical protein
MLREIAQLAPWYDLALKRRGRSSFGISGLTIEDAARHAASCLRDMPQDAGVQLKRACDDIKAYYYEAVAAQPGNVSVRAIDGWFWRETAAAKVFIAVREACLASDDKSLKPLGQTSLVPRWVQHQLA